MMQGAPKNTASRPGITRVEWIEWCMIGLAGGWLISTWFWL